MRIWEDAKENSSIIMHYIILTVYTIFNVNDLCHFAKLLSSSKLDRPRKFRPEVFRSVLLLLN